MAGVMLAGRAAQASEPAPVYPEHLDLSSYFDAPRVGCWDHIFVTTNNVEQGHL